MRATATLVVDEPGLYTFLVSSPSTINAHAQLTIGRAQFLSVENAAITGDGQSLLVANIAAISQPSLGVIELAAGEYPLELLAFAGRGPSGGRVSLGVAPGVIPGYSTVFQALGPQAIEIDYSIMGLELVPEPAGAAFAACGILALMAARRAGRSGRRRADPV